MSLRQVNLARIRDLKRKSRAWSAVQRDWPELAAFLRSEQFALMRSEFGCMPIVYVDEAGHVVPTQEKDEPSGHD